MSIVTWQFCLQHGCMTTTLNPPRHENVESADAAVADAPIQAVPIETGPTGAVVRADPPVAPRGTDVPSARARRQPIARRVVAEMADLLRVSATPSNRVVGDIQVGDFLRHW